jgi:hypothetical protein
MGRLKKYKIYKFFTEDLMPKLSITEVDHTKSNLKEIIRRANNTNYHDEGLPLPVNSNSKIIGVFKGTLPHKVDNRKYIDDPRVGDVFKDYDRKKMSNKRVMSGSWQHSCKNLEIMASKKEKKFSTDELIDGLFSRTDIEFKLPFITYFSLDMIDGLLTKASAFSGLLTSKLFFSRRKDTVGFMKSFAKEYYEFIIGRNQFVYDMSLSFVGGREKRIDLTDEYKDQKTRVILMNEDIPTLIGQLVSAPLTKGFQRLNDGFSFIGRSMEQRNFLDITNHIDCDLKETIAFNADFSGHDNHVDENQIVVAFAVLRLCFPKNWKFMDKLFIYSMSGMIYKRIVLPESKLIYCVTKGIATGHPFTSLVNTLCAYMTFATAIHKTCNEKEIKQSYLYVAGDDVIGKVPLTKLKDIGYVMSNVSGMKIDDISKTSGPLYTTNPLYTRSFLKKKFNHISVAWNDYELIDNLKFSTNGFKTSVAEIVRIRDMLMNGPADYQLNNLCLELVKTHLERPRIRGPGYESYSPSLASLPNTKYSMGYLERHKTFKFTSEFKQSIIKQFNNRMRLANRWFIQAQIFPALGYKDEAYWINATKVLIPPERKPYKYRLWYFYLKLYGKKWQIDGDY